MYNANICVHIFVPKLHVQTGESTNEAGQQGFVQSALLTMKWSLIPQEGTCGKRLIVKTSSQLG